MKNNAKIIRFFIKFIIYSFSPLSGIILADNLLKLPVLIL